MVIVVVLLLSSLLNAAYFMPIVYKAFFCRPEDALFENKVKEAPAFCVVPLVITAIISIALLFYPQPFLELATMTVNQIVGT
jgi:multicomponent Na+:H+ antiporter subunit D